MPEILNTSINVEKSPLKPDEIRSRMSKLGIDVDAMFATAKSATPSSVDSMLAKQTIRFCASTSDVDRDGDIIEADGWVFDDFDKNPVFLEQHNSRKPPIGNVINHEIIDGKMVTDVFFHLKTEESRMYHDLYSMGIMKAVSVGFKVLARKRYETEEERAAAGLGVWGMHSTKQALLELSAVSVPANPNAVSERDFSEALSKSANSGKLTELITKAITDSLGGVNLGELSKTVSNIEKTISEFEERMKAHGVNSEAGTEEPETGDEGQADEDATNTEELEKLFSKFGKDVA